MKYVLDSSVAFKWVLVETDKDKADLLRDDFRNGVHEMIAPDVFPHELAHALTRADRQGRTKARQALTLCLDVMATSPLLHAGLPLSLRAIDISSKMHLGFYDCLYVSLAEREGCQFVTADAKLVKNLQPKFPFIVDLATFP